MTRTHSRPWFAAALLLGTIVSMLSQAAQAQLAHRLTAITGPPSPNYVYATALNNKGEVVGTAEPVGVRAFHWNDGVYTDYGNYCKCSLGDPSFNDINDRSVIIGTASQVRRGVRAYELS